MPNDTDKSQKPDALELNNYYSQGVPHYKPAHPPKPQPTSDLNKNYDEGELKYDATRKRYYRGEPLPSGNHYSFWLKAAGAVAVGVVLYKTILPQ
jgi:hypothetical protein